LNKWIFGIIFLISFSVLFSSQDAFAVLLFQDDFSTDPMSNGWTENFVVDSADGIHPIPINVPPHVGHGNEVILEKNSPNSPDVVTKRFFSINRIISTVGFENIQISLTAHQTSDNYEPVDFLEISVDTNGDGTFDSVLKDVNIWEGIEDQNPDDTIASNGNTSPTSTGFIPLPNTGANIPNLNIKIEASFNSQREDYFLTEVEVIGDAIEVPGNVIGGKILEIDNYTLLVAITETNPVLTGLVGITLAGIAGQAVWFVHRRKNS